MSPGSFLIIFFIAFFSLSSPRIHGQAKFYAPEIFSPKVSGAVCGFSPKGDRIYFVREDTTEKKLFIYQAKRKSNLWSNATLMSFSGKYNDVGGRLSADGKKFYFTSDRPGGSTRADDAWNIWVSKLENNTWSNPEPLTSINNKGLECCPVPIDNDRLLFSADRDKATSWWMFILDLNNGTENPADSINQDRTWQWPSSLVGKNLLLLNSMRRPDTKGMDDIYVSVYKEKKWTRPLNLGEAINTRAYEDGAILSPDKKFLIFCRHDTHETPSQVMYIEWKPVYNDLLKRSKGK